MLGSNNGYPFGLSLEDTALLADVELLLAGSTELTLLVDAGLGLLSVELRVLDTVLLVDTELAMTGFTYLISGC